MKTYVVTWLGADRVPIRKLWDPDRPLPLGQPARWLLEKTEGGVRVRELSDPRKGPSPARLRRLDAGTRLELEPGLLLELEPIRWATPVCQDPGLKISRDGKTWTRPEEQELSRVSPGLRFSHVNAPDVGHSSARGTDPEALWFRKAVQASLGGVASLCLMLMLWPKPQAHDAELVPAQFAKIVLTPPRKPEPAAPAAAPATQASRSSARASVVQAFRARTLQSAVKGLLKGGMTRLLAQSDIVTGAGGTEQARRLFSTKDEALRATASDTGLMQGRKVELSALGGGNSGGYGKGVAAAVHGQGKSLVAMDTPGAAVEEGLTKEEVGEVIHRHMAEVRYCYEAAMLRQPEVEGKLLISFVIGAPGSVKTAQLKQSTLPDPRLDDCVIRRLLSWKFPNTKGGIDVAVTYPFLFKTLGR